MKKFEEVAHLYMGCVCEYKEMRYRYKEDDWETYESTNRMHLTHDTFGSYKTKKDLKPILRPLSDMTEREAIRFIELHRFYGKHITLHHEVYRGAVHFKVIYDSQKNRRWCKSISITGETPEQFAYLLSRHFDLFGLIEAGEAIDATTLNPNPYATA